MNKRFFDGKMISLWVTFLVFDIGMLTLGPKGTLDARLYYSPNEAAQFLKGLTPDQARLYFINELFDLLLIVTYSALLFLTLIRLSSRPNLKWLAAVPGVFDLVETSVILWCIDHPPHIALFPWLGVITTLKWLSGVGLLFLCATLALRTKYSSK